jgi:hypothetical protein
MKKLTTYLKTISVLMLLFVSCTKENLSPENGAGMEALVAEKKLDIQSIKGGTVSQCYNDMAEANYSAITSHASDLSFSSGAAAIYSNYNEFVDCSMTSSPGGGGDEVPGPGNEVPYSIHGLDPAAVFLSLSQTYRGTTSNTYLQALLDAYAYARANYSSASTSDERMMAIGQAIYNTSASDIFINYAPTGLDNNIYNVISAIEVLAGKTRISSSIYNTYIAPSSSAYVQFPAAFIAGWVGLKLGTTTPQLWAVAYHSISFSGYTSGYLTYHLTAADTFNGVSLFTPYTSAYYYLNKLYQDSAHTTYVPDGFYRLPAMFTQYEIDNFLVEIVNGEVVVPYAGE